MFEILKPGKVYFINVQIKRSLFNLLISFNFDKLNYIYILTVNCFVARNGGNQNLEQQSIALHQAMLRRQELMDKIKVNTLV